MFESKALPLGQTGPAQARKKNESGTAFKANCSKDTGQYRKTIFNLMGLCFSQGVTDVWISDVDRTCLMGV